ncbi:WhiB family transcriptional regulator [Streptomyces sp. NPDC052114]|uniref:WhiB family transcriptional regulator n=1 Tax=unclassified Streptomyces TaxID=2593676 RepID=UPI0034179254
MEWLRDAACRNADPELFFPIGSTGPAVRDVREAKRICARCPVIEECLDYALTTGQTSGVWGGTCEEERKAPRRARLRRAAVAGESRPSR